MVRAFMCLELLFNAININLVTFSNYFDIEQLKGEIFSIFVVCALWHFHYKRKVRI
jgi:NADH:ubiquinone oxidoreductase subunit K